MKPFGEPNLGDNTSEWEKMVNEASESVKEDLKLAATMMPRPLGSKKVNWADQDVEYPLLTLDPQAGLTMMNAKFAEYLKDDPATAWDETQAEFIKWAKTMEARRDR